MAILLYRRTVTTDSAQGHSIDLLVLLPTLIFVGARLEQVGAPGPPLTAALFAAVLAYPVLTVRTLGGTLGQRLLGVRVVAAEGGAPSWKQALRRMLGQALVMALLMATGPFGFVWLMVNRSRKGLWWHDAFAGTRLIRAGEPDPGPQAPRPPMSAERKRVLSYLVAAVVGGLALIGSVSVAAQHFLVAGTLHLVAPHGAELRVHLDGQPAVVIPPGTHRPLKVARGPHVLSVRLRGEETSIPFETSGGFWQAFVPVEPAQCFVQLDVTRSHYGASLSDGTRPLPDLEQRYQTKDVVVLTWPDDVFFDPEELPDSSEYSVKLMAQLGCDELRLSDEELLRGTLGFKGRSWREINADAAAP